MTGMIMWAWLREPRCSVAKGSRTWMTHIQIPSPLLGGCAILVKLLNLSGPLIPSLLDRNLINKIMPIKQCKAETIKSVHCFCDWKVGCDDGLEPASVGARCFSCSCSYGHVPISDANSEAKRLDSLIHWLALWPDKGLHHFGFLQSPAFLWGWLLHNSSKRV